MGIYVTSLGDIVGTQAGYAGVKLISYDDEVRSREDAESIAERLRNLFGVTDTVWYVAQFTHRVSPLFDSKVDTRKWLRDNTPPARLGEYEAVERKGSEVDTAYTYEELARLDREFGDRIAQASVTVETGSGRTIS